MLDALIARFSPCTVTLAQPVVAAFTMMDELKLANPVDSIPEVVPAREPTVCDSLTLRTVPPPPWHASNVSDNHKVLSQLDSPALPPKLSIVTPKPAPITVKDDDPLEARLLASTRLICGRPTDKSEVELPRHIPLVTTSLAVPFSPSIASDSTALSDVHKDAQQALASILNAPVYRAGPKLPPPTVTLTDPVIT